MGPRSNPQDTERPAERQAARFEQEKIWRGTAMSKGCAETVGDTSDDNPDPEPPWKRRGQAARKGGRERGSEDEETLVAYPERVRGRMCGRLMPKLKPLACRRGRLEPFFYSTNQSLPPVLV